MSDHDHRNDPQPSNQWIGTILAALGEHIRRLEDANSKLRYANQSHEAFREYDREQIRKATLEFERGFDGSAMEQLALDNNALIDLCRNWTSWAGQAQQFRKDVMALLHDHGFDRQADMNAVARFNTRVRDGAYDVIPLPVPTEADPVNSAPPKEEIDAAISDSPGGGTLRGRHPGEEPKVYAGSFTHHAEPHWPDDGTPSSDRPPSAPAGAGVHIPAAVEGGSGQPDEDARGKSPA